jgi:hypothetical protein
MRIIGVNGARHKISGTLQKDGKYTVRKGELKLFDQMTPTEIRPSETGETGSISTG